MKLLCEAPQIVLVENFLTKEECQQLIELAKPKLLKSTVVNAQSGIRESHPARTSFGAHFSISENSVVIGIEEKIETLTNWPKNRAEGLQVLNYQIGGEYKRHFDYFDPNLAGSGVHLKEKGQRFATVIMYLNTPELGGTTNFPRLNISVPAVVGHALFFSNVKDDLTIDPLSEHAGMPVIAGEKWIATKWLREQ